MASDRLRVLVIGGSGFLSGTLSRLAVDQGHQVWAVTRGRRPLPEGVTPLAADRHDGPAFEAAVAGAGTDWDLVVDCIGFDPADARQDLDVFRHRTPQLVFVSTDFVYDPVHRRFPQPEATEHYLTDGYGGKKRQCERVLVEGDRGNMAVTILRPCHIYGPGSQLGCLPKHGRDSELIARLRAGQALELVGGGHFLQQPILARDLADLALSVAGCDAAEGQVFCAAGPDIVESREYYQIIADELGVLLRVDEVPVAAFRAENPGAAPFLCHRIYDLGKLRAGGLKSPSTPLRDGLAEHVRSLLAG